MNKIAPMIVMSLCMAFSVVAGAEDNIDTKLTVPAACENNNQPQLDAQQKINLQLRKRIEELERKLASYGQPADLSAKVLDINARQPELKSASTDELSAIEQTLLTKGVVLLQNNSYRFRPGVSWNHYGKGSNREDVYSETLALEAGLPWEMMASIQIPYVQKNYYDGTNKGFGDLSLTLSKQLLSETDNHPSLVAQAGYSPRTGKDAFGQIPIGSGFQSFSGAISAAKHLSPFAVYGNVSISHARDRYVDINNFQGYIRPGNTYSFGSGISLAATPAISLNAGASYSLSDKLRYEPTLGDPFESSHVTIGYINLGSGFLITRNLFLDISLSAGITQDADSFVLSVSLPYHF